MISKNLLLSLLKYIFIPALYHIIVNNKISIKNKLITYKAPSLGDISKLLNVANGFLLTFVKKFSCNKDSLCIL